MQTASAILDPPSGGIAPTDTADSAGPGSSDGSFEDKNIHAEGVNATNAMQSGEDNKATSLAAAGINDTEGTASAKKRTRQRKLWFRDLSPVRTRSSTGSLPSSRKKSYIQEDVTPIKPRQLRARTNSAVKKPTPTRKRKSAPVGRAPKRSRKSLTPGDKRAGGGVGDDIQAAEIVGRDDESDYEHKVKTPGVSDDEASSTGQFYDEPDTDACAKPDESAFRDGVKTPGISGDEASSPGRYYERDNYAYAKSDEPAPMDGINTPGASSDAASSLSEFYDEPYADACAKPDESALGGEIKTPDVSDDEASSPGGYYGQDTRAHAKPIGCGHKDGVKALDVSDSEEESLGNGQSEHPVDNESGTPARAGSQDSIQASDEGSTNFQADEDGAEVFKEAEAAISDGEPKLGKTDLTEHQVEDRLGVQSRHGSVEPEAKPELSPPGCHGPDKQTDVEAHEVTHPDEAPEVANFNAPPDVEFAMIVQTNFKTPEDFIANFKTFKFQSTSRHHVRTTHVFIYFASPASQIQFVVSVSPTGVVASPPIGEHEGTGPCSTDQPCTEYEYEYGVSALWQLAEAIPLVELQEVYGFEGPPTEPTQLPQEFLAAHPLASMQKIF